MFWYVVSLYIFTRCLHFDSPCGSTKYYTIQKDIQRYCTLGEVVIETENERSSNCEISIVIMTSSRITPVPRIELTKENLQTLSVNWFV